MKVLIATKEKQGIRKNDFSFTDEGEFVKFGFQCDGESVDGGCGCMRSVCGFDTQKATTTFKVEDEEITKEDYINKFLKSEKEAGWFKEKDKEEFTDMAEELLSIADQFKTGTILEKRGSKIKERR